MFKKLILVKEFFVAAAIFITLTLFFGVEGFEAASYSVIFYIISQVISRKDTFPVFQLMLIFPWLQWVIAPIMSFYFPSDNLSYVIVQSKSEYLSFALTGTVAYSIGLFIFYQKKQTDNLVKILSEYKEHKNGKRGVYMIVVGAVCYLFRNSVPDSLSFVFFLLSGLAFVGSYYVIFSTIPKSRKIALVVGVHIGLIVQNIRQGSFQEMVLWGISLLLFFPYLIKLKPIIKLAIFGGGFILVSIIQAVKADYRVLKDSDSTGAGTGSVGLFLNTIDAQDMEANLFEENNLQRSIVRYNQGWIISRILANTPANEPFAEGETIKNAITASIFPRFMLPNKVESGGAKNFPRFTGMTLIRTSMDLSPLGEAYANYDKEGAYIFMFFFGMFFSYVIKFCIGFSIKYRTELILWLPLILLQALKAENDIATSLNHITKASMLVFFLLTFILKPLNRRQLQGSL